MADRCDLIRRTGDDDVDRLLDGQPAADVDEDAVGQVGLVERDEGIFSILARVARCCWRIVAGKPKHESVRTLPLTNETQAIARRALGGSTSHWLFHAPVTTNARLGQWHSERL